MVKLRHFMMPERPLGRLQDLAVILAVAATVLALNWVGFYGFDDWEYSKAAEGWVTEGLFVGDTHWALRHPHVLAIAASYALFGYGELQLVMPTVLYFFLLLCVIYFFLGESATWNAGLISCLLIILTPLLCVITTMIRPDITEAFFIFLSAFLFCRAGEGNGTNQSRTLFFAGVAAGLAWLTRETSIGLIFTFGVMFLLGWRYSRRYYWMLAAGFIAVVAVEMIYMTAMNGEPLYRYIIDLNLQQEAMTRHAKGVESNVFVIGEAKSSVAGNVSVHWLIDPFLAILVNEEFGLTYWIAIPIAAWLCMSPRVGKRHRDIARFLSLLAVLWFIMISYGMNLREQPRYYLVPTIVAVMMIGIWAANYRDAIASRLWVPAIAAYVLVNVLVLYLYVQEGDAYPAHIAAAVAAETSETVYTDSRTEFVGKRLFHILRTEGSLSELPPPPGAIYLYFANLRDVGRDTYNTTRLPPGWRVVERDESQTRGMGIMSVIERYQPPEGWIEIRRYDPGRRILGIWIEKLNLRRFLPARTYAELDRPIMPVIIYRTPAAVAN